MFPTDGLLARMANVAASWGRYPLSIALLPQHRLSQTCAQPQRSWGGSPRLPAALACVWLRLCRARLSVCLYPRLECFAANRMARFHCFAFTRIKPNLTKALPGQPLSDQTQFGSREVGVSFSILRFRRFGAGCINLRKPVCNLPHSIGCLLIECIKIVAVDIDLGEDLLILADQHHQFRSG
jgi:hypothetical protein